MSVIHAAVIHKLIKEPHGPTSVQTRDAELELNEPVKNLVNQISEFYGSKASKGYGRFEDDELTYPSSTVLRDIFRDHSIAFVDGTKKLMDVLAGKAMQAPLSKGGYVLMAHGQSSSKEDWFLVAIINNVASSAVNEETLEIIESVHIDVDNLRVAGRVNVSTWLAGDEHSRYVGFLKHRGEVADYFKYFLGCSVVIKDAEETKRLVEALRTFARSENLDQEREDDFLRKAHAYCNEHSKSKQPISLEELTNVAWPQEPKKLQKSLAEQNIEINDGFVPDGRSLRSLLKFHGKSEYWTVDIDRRALIKGHAQYLPEKGELILRNLPPALKTELDAEVRDD
ncbi:MAG: hypothetical protein BGO63_15625 [Candidatus Accumulibacter sp. 66-26]|nr:nucleoid-associated protein [Accumulibacter sp.]OJW46955.1 MAG: hypothetical protein BGO63_15625 [Candidatus Accumulibacter sp. 66-26]